MKTVHLLVRHGDRATTLVFSRFPIRIGREPPAECRLAFPFVSRAHAALELHGGRLMLRDVGSRGGTFISNSAVRLEPGVFIDLEPAGFEFQIGRLSIRATLLDDGTQTPGRGTLALSADGNEDPSSPNKTRAYEPTDDATRAYDGAGFDPGALDQQAVRADLADVLSRYRSARAELEAFVRDTASAPNTPGRIEAQEALYVAPTISPEAERRTLAPPASIAPRRDGEAAMRSLQEIASHYVPYAPPLVDATTIGSFHQQLSSTLRILFDGFAALRYSHRAERAERLQSVGTGIDVGARLLDWTSSDDAHGLFEREIVAMIRHHAHVTYDVSAGVAKLLTELDPDRIEAAGDRSWLRAFQYRRFWETYRYRHHRLTSDDSLSSLFGPRAHDIQRALAGRSAPGALAIEATGSSLT